MFKDVDIVRIFLRNRVLRLRQNIHWPTFMSSFSTVFERAFLVDIPIDLFCFFKLQDMESSSYSFMVMYDKRLGIRIKQRTLNTAAMP